MKRVRGVSGSQLSHGFVRRERAQAGSRCRHAACACRAILRGARVDHARRLRSRTGFLVARSAAGRPAICLAARVSRRIARRGCLRALVGSVPLARSSIALIQDGIENNQRSRRRRSCRARRAGQCAVAARDAVSAAHRRRSTRAASRPVADPADQRRVRRRHLQPAHAAGQRRRSCPTCSAARGVRSNPPRRRPRPRRSSAKRVYITLAAQHRAGRDPGSLAARTDRGDAPADRDPDAVCSASCGGRTSAARSRCPTWWRRKPRWRRRACCCRRWRSSSHSSAICSLH